MQSVARRSLAQFSYPSWLPRLQRNRKHVTEALRDVTPTLIRLDLIVVKNERDSAPEI